MNLVRKLLLLSLISINGHIETYAQINKSEKKPTFFFRDNDLQGQDQQKIVMISIWKSGTNLLKKLINLLVKTHNFSWKQYNKFDTEFINSHDKNFYADHLFYKKNYAELFSYHKLKTLFIYRDPRDQLVSWIFHAKKNIFNKPELIELQTKSFDELFDMLLPDQVTTYQSFMPWKDESFVLTTSFEKLVGPKGGGDIDTQLHEILNIAHYLDINIDDKEVLKLSKDLFGGTTTFREGQIGSWKKYFSEKQKESFKRYSGQLLIDLGYEKDFDW